ncbi:MAG TPA: hypothetical protein VEG24_06995 [Gaiellaceae bacterium]|nr:hypothetical protein [Gaiellaceae bacterium]
MAADRLTRRLAEARHDLEHAAGHARLRGELGQAKRGQRRLLGRLEDDITTSPDPVGATSS